MNSQNFEISKSVDYALVNKINVIKDSLKSEKVLLNYKFKDEYIREFCEKNN